MSSFFLRIKRWQVFFIIWVLPLVLIISTSFSLFSKLDGLLFISISLIITLLTTLGWIWSVFSFLKNTNPDAKSLILPFYFSYWIPTIYFSEFTLTSLYNIFIEKTLLRKHEWDIRGVTTWLMVLSILYGLTFIARFLKEAELKRTPALSEYFIDFLLLVFAPIGIWFIQPRVNRLTEMERLD